MPSNGVNLNASGPRNREVATLAPSIEQHISFVPTPGFYSKLRTGDVQVCCRRPRFMKSKESNDNLDAQIERLQATSTICKPLAGACSAARTDPQETINHEKTSDL
jgi:hypothetical protein